MAQPTSMSVRGLSAAPRGERRRPILALALGVAVAAALSATGPSWACRIMSDVAAAKATIWRQVIDGRSHRANGALAELGQPNSDEYVPQLTRIIRFPADEL